MLIGTLFGVVLIPGLYILFEKWREHIPGKDLPTAKPQKVPGPDYEAEGFTPTTPVVTEHLGT
jgi:hypothetical protein